MSTQAKIEKLEAEFRMDVDAARSQEELDRDTRIVRNDMCDAITEQMRSNEDGVSVVMFPPIDHIKQALRTVWLEDFMKGSLSYSEYREWRINRIIYEHL
jgi:hypothetical protein